MKKILIYATGALAATGIMMADLAAWGTTTIEKTTTTTIEKTSPSTAPSTVVVTKTPAPPKNFFVCYNRITKYVTHNVNIERCNPYGMCRRIIVPVHRKVVAVKNCQINTRGCSSMSKFGWYPTGMQAQKGLSACRNQPIVVERR
jgi:hypothetical protein